MVGRNAPRNEERHSACASFLLYCGIQAAAARHMHQYCDYQSERGEGENRILSRSHVDASHVTHIKIGVWPTTGFEWQMVSTFSFRIFRLGILEYLSRRSVYFGKFPFGQTKTVLPFTSQPKFRDFFGKW